MQGQALFCILDFKGRCFSRRPSPGKKSDRIYIVEVQDERRVRGCCCEDMLFNYLGHDRALIYRYLVTHQEIKLVKKRGRIPGSMV